MAASTEITELPRAASGAADQLAEINRKLDVLTQQVGYLHRRTAAIEELKDELVPIARDAMGALSEELVSVEHEFNSEEILYLLRKLLRNTPRFIRLLDRLESLEGLATEVEPLGKEVVRTVVDELEAIERKGHFRLIRGALKALDRVAGHFSQDDIDQFVGSSVLLVDTVRSLTQPEVLGLANSAAAISGQDGEARVGVFRLMRAMREPDVQRGLAIALAVLRTLGRGRAQEAEGEQDEMDEENE